LGVKVVIAESFERIHRSNLVGMGILPLEFPAGETAETLGLTGKEKFDITGIAEDLYPFKKIKVIARKDSGETITFEAKARLDSAIDVAYFENGGILQYVLRGFLK
jgi:aconitate hydratase